VHQGSGAVMEGINLTCEAHVPVAEEREGRLAKDKTQQIKRILKNTPRVLRPIGLGKKQGSLWGKGGPSRQTRLVVPDPLGKSNGNFIFEFQLNLDFDKTLRFSTRRFRRNLEKGIFPKIL
jgi:hypothetical protein